ncbi:MAG: ParA family protein [Deltaproteobacteria bacterium]|nr:ParA family protein [Deltaproteobacteria bacterium]
MAKIITVTNQKGGVGKTTTVINLGASLAAAEKKTLLVDMDPQGNAGSGFGIGRDQVSEKNIYHVLVQEKNLKDIILRTELEGLDIAPSNQDLIGAEIELVNEFSRETRLKQALDGVKDLYDYILIDSPPSLGLLTVNALTASDSYLVPMQCEYYAMEGLSQLTRLAGLVKKGLNPKIEQEGVLLTMFDSRNNLCHQVAGEIRAHFKSQVYEAVIPRNVKLSECPSHGKPILLYDVNSKGAISYLSLAKEMIRKHEQGQLNLVGHDKKELPLQTSV